MEMETGPSSRKGLCGHPPKVWKHSGQQEGECTTYFKESRMLSKDSMACCSVVLTAKNREKARERRYLPVCLHLTQVGTGSKGLMVMSRKIRSANVSTFLKADPSGSAFFLQ